MIKKHFGTADDYTAALGAVIAEGVPEKHIELLRAHLEAPRHTATASQLARAVGYANYGGVNMQYGTLAHRVASRLGVVAPPNGFGCSFSSIGLVRSIRAATRGSSCGHRWLRPYNDWAMRGRGA